MSIGGMIKIRCHKLEGENLEFKIIKCKIIHSWGTQVSIGKVYHLKHFDIGYVMIIFMLFIAKSIVYVIHFY